MIPRLIVFLPVAVAAIVLLFRLEERGRLAPVNQTYVEWLLANSRGEFKPREHVSGDSRVVFVTLTDYRADVFAEWPPDPGDYALLLRNLKKFEPEVVAIHPLLEFNNPGELALRGLRNEALGYSSLIFGVPLVLDPAEELIDPIVRSVLTPVRNVSGSSELAPRFSGIRALPDRRTRIQGYLAFNRIHMIAGEEPAVDPERFALVAGLGDDLYPSLALEAILLHARTPLASTRFRLGQGAGVFVREDRFIPLNEDGSLQIPAAVNDLIIKVDAVELLTTGIALHGMISESDLLDVLPGSIVIFGYDDPESRTIELADGRMISAAELTAMAAAAMMSMPSIMRLGLPWLYAIAGLSLLLSIWVLRKRRHKAVTGAALLLFLNFLIGLLLFQVTAVWWGPTIPASLFLLAGFVGFLIPLRPLRPGPNEQPATEQEAEKPAAEDQGPGESGRLL